MEKQGKEAERRTREIQIKETKERKKNKKDKIKSIDPPEKAENWLGKLFFGFLYYRSESRHYSSKENHPKVKLPRSRHK